MKHFKRRIKASSLLIMAIAGPGWVGAAPITFNTALPVAAGEFVFREQIRWLRSDDDPSGADRELRALAAITLLGYGVNSKLVVFGVLPYAYKILATKSVGNRTERDNRGLGDAIAFARYTFWKKDTLGRTFRLAGIGGFTAPTGDDAERDRFGRLPPSLQGGSGGWNLFAGVISTYQTVNYQMDGQLSYHENRAANDIAAGDETRLDLSLQYRLWPTELGSGLPDFLYAVLELNFLHQGKSRINGQSDDNSGGVTVWLSPGLQYVTKRWVLEAVVQKPISQNLNGLKLGNDLMITTSFRMNF